MFDLSVVLKEQRWMTNLGAWKDASPSPNAIPIGHISLGHRVPNQSTMDETAAHLPWNSSVFSSQTDYLLPLQVFVCARKTSPKIQQQMLLYPSTRLPTPATLALTPHVRKRSYHSRHVRLPPPPYLIFKSSHTHTLSLSFLPLIPMACSLNNDLCP